MRLYNQTVCSIIHVQKRVAVPLYLQSQELCFKKKIHHYYLTRVARVVLVGFLHLTLFSKSLFDFIFCISRKILNKSTVNKPAAISELCC